MKRMAKQNDGAPGVDGVTFEAIEAQGAEAVLEQLRNELTARTYKPLPARRQEIPKDCGKVRVLSIPAIRSSWEEHTSIAAAGSSGISVSRLRAECLQVVSRVYLARVGMMVCSVRRRPAAIAAWPARVR